VLAQCPALAHLDLSGNSNFGAAGAGRFAGVLNSIAIGTLLAEGPTHAASAKSLARLLAQCTALTHLNLGSQ